MSDQDTQPGPPDQPGQPGPPDQPGHSSRWWIVATVTFALLAIGLGAWAFSLRSDVDDKDAQLTAQQQQLEEQQGVAGEIREAASGIADNAQQALDDLGAQLDEIQGIAEGTEEDAQQVIDEAEAIAADAQQRADSAEGELDKAQAEAEEAGARADAAAGCARGYLSAIGGVFDAESFAAGVEQAKAEFQTLNGSCADVLSQ